MGLRPWGLNHPPPRHVQDDRQLPPPPGSLSNCCDNPAFSKVIESTGLLPPHCVVQASSRNGRLLNSHPGFGHTNLLSILSNFPWEQLGRTCCTNVASPAHWKLCTKQLRSNWYLLAPAPSHWVCSEEMALTSHRVAKRPRTHTKKGTLCCDMVCFITPLATVSGWLCLLGALGHLGMHGRLEAMGLNALSRLDYLLWMLLVSFWYHLQLYSEWRKTNQKVRLKIREADGSEDPHHSLLATGLFKKVAEETPVWSPDWQSPEVVEKPEADDHALPWKDGSCLTFHAQPRCFSGKEPQQSLLCAPGWTYFQGFYFTHYCTWQGQMDRPELWLLVSRAPVGPEGSSKLLALLCTGQPASLALVTLYKVALHFKPAPEWIKGGLAG